MFRREDDGKSHHDKHDITPRPEDERQGEGSSGCAPPVSSGAVVDTALRRMFTEDFIATHPEVVSERAAVLLRAEPSHFATACRALAELDLRPALREIRNRTLVVVGALDATTPPALARELAAGIADAALVEIADCAHCPPIEQPAAFLTAVQTFLDEP